MADVVQGRIYLPPTDESNPTDRDVLHPETNAENVLMNVGTNNDQTVKLSEVLDNVVHITSTGQASTYTGQQDCVVIERVTTV